MGAECFDVRVEGFEGCGLGVDGWEVDVVCFVVLGAEGGGDFVEAFGAMPCVGNKDDCCGGGHFVPYLD